jgi:hypothetical protein
VAAGAEVDAAGAGGFAAEAGGLAAVVLADAAGGVFAAGVPFVVAAGVADPPAAVERGDVRGVPTGSPLHPEVPADRGCG